MANQYGGDGQIEITIERGGETITAFVPEGSTISALIREGHLRGIEVASTRINGAPAGVATTLREGDEVDQVPKSGKQGQ